MIIDKSLQLLDDKRVNASFTSDVIDFGQATPNTGMSDRLSLVINVTRAMAGTGSLALSLQDSDDNAAFADVVTLPSLVAADAPLGAQFVLPMPVTHRRYVRLSGVETGVADLKLSAQIVTGIQANTPLPDAVE